MSSGNFDAYGKPYTVGQQAVYPSQVQAYGQTGTANAPPQFNPPAYTQPVYRAEVVSAPQPYGIQVVQPGEPVPNYPAGYAQMPVQIPQGEQRIPYTTPIDDTIPLLGLGIFQTGLYLAWPWSCGCACTNTTLCCTNQQFTCISTEPPNPMDSACICNRTDCQCCHPVKTCTKWQCRFYFLEARFAIPGSLIPSCADPDYPLLINLLGWTVCYCEKDTGCFPVMTCCEDVRGIKRTYQEKLIASRQLQQ